MLHQTLSQIDVSVAPDYLLVCRADAPALTHGTWYFALESAAGAPVFEAGDEELGDLNRLTLLAAIRGLESIDGPANVTLLSSNRYLIRSLADSLPRWRENDFVWEHFGRRIDVQHADLWRRIDRALSIHRVEACLISSRLVSAGKTAGAGRADQRPAEKQEAVESGVACEAPRQTTSRQPAKDRPLIRLDGAHPTAGPRGRAGGPRGRAGNRGLRGGPDSHNRTLKEPAAVPRRRFTAADLLEAV